MAPPYVGPTTIQIYAWRLGSVFYACQHGWHHPGIELPMVGGSSDGVVEKLEELLRREVSRYLDGQWPFYSEELSRSVLVAAVIYLEDPCCQHRWGRL